MPQQQRQKIKILVNSPVLTGQNFCKQSYMAHMQGQYSFQNERKSFYCKELQHITFTTQTIFNIEYITFGTKQRWVDISFSKSIRFFLFFGKYPAMDAHTTSVTAGVPWLRNLYDDRAMRHRVYMDALKKIRDSTAPTLPTAILFPKLLIGFYSDRSYESAYKIWSS